MSQKKRTHTAAASSYTCDRGTDDSDDAYDTVRVPGVISAAADTRTVATAAGSDDDDDDEYRPRIPCAPTPAIPPPVAPLPAVRVPPPQPAYIPALRAALMPGSIRAATSVGSAAPAPSPPAEVIGEFSDDDDGGGSDARPPETHANALRALADATGTPVSMLEPIHDAHVAVEQAFRTRGRLVRARPDGTFAMTMARDEDGLGVAFDDAFRREQDMVPVPGATEAERTQNRMLRMYGSFPRPPPNGLEYIVESMVAYMANLPAYRARTSTPSMRSLIERCVAQRDTPFELGERRKYLFWQSARDEVHYLVEAGVRRSPTNPAKEIHSRPCVMGEKCLGRRLITQLSGRRKPGVQTFTPIGMITKRHLAAHYTTGEWPAAEAGHVPCIICVRAILMFLQCTIPLDRHWLPFVVAQTIFNSVDTFHGYRREFMLLPTGQPSMVLAPVARWDTNAMSVYYDEEMGLHRINQDLMMVKPLGPSFNLSYFASDVEMVDDTETSPLTPLQAQEPRATPLSAARPPVGVARPPPPLLLPPRHHPPDLPAPTTSRMPAPFFERGVR